MLVPTLAQAEQHYADHVGRSYYPRLTKFICSGPVCAQVWEGANICDGVRRILGATKETKNLPGTIRGDFSSTMQLNIVHASDSPEEAECEIALWFQPDEITSWKQTNLNSVEFQPQGDGTD